MFDNRRGLSARESRPRKGDVPKSPFAMWRRSCRWLAGRNSRAALGGGLIRTCCAALPFGRYSSHLHSRLAGGRKIAALSRYQLSAGNRCTIAPRQTSTTSSTRRVSARSVRAAWSLAMIRPRPPPLWAGSISRTSYRCRTDKDHRVPVGPRGQCLERGGRIPVLSAGGQRQLL
jgi:hypothetical protein